MKSVAIEREFGSGGRDIGIRIAKEAQIPYYDGPVSYTRLTLPTICSV